jgi:hypothetical protein
MLVDDDPIGQTDLYALEHLRIAYGFDDLHNAARGTQMLLLPQVSMADFFC